MSWWPSASTSSPHGVAGLGVAPLIDRIEVRRIMIIGAAVAGMALALLGQTRELWQLRGLFMLFGIGNTGVSIVIATTLVTRWFLGGGTHRLGSIRVHGCCRSQTR